MQTITHHECHGRTMFSGRVQPAVKGVSFLSRLFSLIGFRETVFSKRKLAVQALRLSAILLIGFVSTPDANAQVLLDNFTRSNGNSVGNSWVENESGSTVVTLNTNRVQLGTGGGSDLEFLYRDCSTLFVTTPASNTGVMTWMANIRQSRTDPGGFDFGNYGIAYVLGCTSTDFTTGNGYAVLFGQGGTSDPLRLVRFAGGLDANTNITNIISATGTDFGNDYLAVKVTYNPSNNQWTLAYASSGSSFPDPSTATYTSAGAAVTNTTYTSSALNYVGAYYSHGSGFSETAYFDNVYIPSAAPFITTQPSASLSVCQGSSVSFTAAAGGSPTVTVKWQKDISGIWTDIVGATSTTYTIASPTLADAGSYRALFTNGIGSTNTNTSVLTVNTAPGAFSVTGGGAFCSGGTGIAIGLSGSASGINYQLKNGASNVGSAVAGTGSALAFGNQTSAGTYTVVATNTVGSCTATMTGNAVVMVNSLPTAFNMTGTGTYCIGSTAPTLGLSGSSFGISYQLFNGASAVGSPVTGTGTSISFGTQPAAGTYTVVATNTTTTCTRTMTTSVTVNPVSIPTVFSVTGGGSLCSGGAGVAIGLSGSETGVNYQLKNGAANVGSAVAGTGSAISFAAQTTAATYTVIATTTTGSCTASMSGSAVVVVNALPSLFTVNGGGSYCAGGAGSTVGLSGSTLGIDYQLYLAASPVGSAVAGTGSAITFGSQTSVGTYTVIATNPSTGCTRTMTGSVSVSTKPIPSASATSSTALICGNGSATLSSTGSSNVTTLQTQTQTVNTNIPSSNSAGLTSTISISGAPATMGAVTNFSVKVNINHNNDNEVEIYLIRPLGTISNSTNGSYFNTIIGGESVCLSADAGGSSNNYINTVFSDAGAGTAVGTGFAPFTGTFKPENLFNLLTGNPNGTWTLKVVDDAGSTVGQLVDWSISMDISDGVSYTWTSSPAGFTSSVQNPGAVTPTVSTNYTVTVTNTNNGCTASSSVQVDKDPVLNVACTILSDESCAGASDGSIDVVASGGTAPYAGDGLQAALTSGSYTFTVTDLMGCTTSCSSTIAVVDNTFPTLSACPTNISVNTAGGCGEFVTWTPPVASDNCAGFVLTSNHNSGDFFPIGLTTVNYMVTDASGNQTSCSFDVTVTDNEFPFLVCPSDMNVNTDAGSCGAVVAFSPIATDNCAFTLTSTPASGSVFPIGTTVVTCEATDASGNQSTCTFNVTVVDAEMPVITCPSNITINTDAGSCDAVVSFSASATDNCSASVVSVPASGSVFAQGTTTVTSTATDAAGNSVSCTFTVTVEDHEQPVISGIPANINLNTSGSCDAIATWIAPSATDNCGTPALTSNFNSGDLFPVGITTVTYTATDASGNISALSFTVTVSDNEDPTIACPANIAVNSDLGSCGAIVNFSVTTTDNCSSSVVSTPASGSLFPIGTTTVTSVATDASGNTATCSFDVTVTDNEDPAIACPANMSVNTDAGSCGAIVNFSVTATDNCSLSVVSTPASGSVFPIGTTTVTSVATDASGNTATCSFDVTVTDNEDPAITCPSNIAVSSDAGTCGAVVNFSVTTSDNCSSSVVSTPASGSVFPIGTTTVTSVATDASGNTSTCSFDVTVTDNEFPAISGCSPVLSITPSSSCGGIVSWTAPTASDNCGTPTLTSNFNPGDAFPAGTTTVTYTATDASGNVTTCSFNVFIADNQDPVITCPSNISVSTDAGSCGAIVSFSVSATDNCSASVISTPASGSFFAIGTTTVTSVATDPSGNTATCSFDVTVTDNEDPAIACPANMSVNTDAGSCGAIVSFSVTTTDNCSSSVVSTPASGTFFALGTTTVTSVATDASGNTSTCSFDVTVTDNEDPAIVCPANMSVNTDAGSWVQS
ncbi:MAG: HYR domain-containing protein [Bacteroidetes bacterium]|nr:HYR domain-containing protein [Bacteroidota bacterium]